MTCPLDFVPVDMLDFQSNQLEVAMKRKIFSAEQIIRILKEGEAVGSIREVCRQHNVTEQTYYRWRKKTMNSRKWSAS